jgi:transcriptional regulator with XRE-family HTH domain
MSIEMKIVGNNIKKMRAKTGLTQKHIADFIGVDQSLISKIESGERAITTETLERLAALFCCPVEYLANEDYALNTYEFAFRTNDIDESDLYALAEINKIALNQMQMDKLIGGLEI